MENILTTLMRALNWQGGTIHQALAALPNKNDCNPSVYRYGFDAGSKHINGDDIIDYKIPINSWDDSPHLNLSYAKGLIDGLAAKERRLNDLERLDGAYSLRHRMMGEA